MCLPMCKHYKWGAHKVAFCLFLFPVGTSRNVMLLILVLSLILVLFDIARSCSHCCLCNSGPLRRWWRRRFGSGNRSFGRKAKNSVPTHDDIPPKKNCVCCVNFWRYFFVFIKQKYLKKTEKKKAKKVNFRNTRCSFFGTFHAIWEAPDFCEAPQTTWWHCDSCLMFVGQVSKSTKIRVRYSFRRKKP